jgi:prephenate dehydratase
MSVVVSYQGEPGAFSSQAALQVFPDCELLPCRTFEDALAAVSDGSARYGMIPIDNSIAGRVADIHHLLPRSGLHIIGEHFLPIRFHLMAVEGATLATLKTVQSHIHALGQCRKIIRKLGLKAEVAADTAGSARQVAEAGDPTRAAIAPHIAAEVYGLKILM